MLAQPSGLLSFRALEYDHSMRRFLQIAFAGWVALSMSMAQAFAFPGDGGAGGYTPVSSTAPDVSGYTRDDSQSDALTAYLKGRRLPLVGAQVLHDPSSGQSAIVLYGFVATAFGKSDATAKARAFLKDPSVVVENRVKVDPEIASLPKSSRHHSADDGSSAVPNPDASGPAAEADPNASSQADADPNAMPGVQGYMDQQNQQAQIQQYQNQQNPLAGGSGGMPGGMVPLVALLGLLSAANGGGGSSFSFGSSGPFGIPNSFGRSSPYQANPSGASPYGSPYGSPYAAPPGAYPSSPYGPSGSPYGPPTGSFSPYP